MVAVQAEIQRVKDEILQVWAFEKKLQETVEITTQEIEEITEEMQSLNGEKLAKYKAMLEAAKDSNDHAAKQLVQIQQRHAKLRSEFTRLNDTK